ncbi:MAG: class I SAM-dependent methyltransferase [Chitinophagaceae bacterium]
MNLNSLQKLVGDTDIYLLDQIMKGRYRQADKILDAGCGTGRNLHWFLQNNMDVYGIDRDVFAINSIKAEHPSMPSEKLQAGSIEKMPFENNFFDHIISSAVLHFAVSTAQFHKMMHEIIRVLKTGGSLFIRMASNIGIEDKVVRINNGVYHIPDGSERFLQTKQLLSDIIQQYPLHFIEPFKTVNVDDKRCMSTLVFEKE